MSFSQQAQSGRLIVQGKCIGCSWCLIYSLRVWQRIRFVRFGWRPLFFRPWILWLAYNLIKNPSVGFVSCGIKVRDQLAICGWVDFFELGVFHWVNSFFRNQIALNTEVVLRESVACVIFCPGALALICAQSVLGKPVSHHCLIRLHVNVAHQGCDA